MRCHKLVDQLADVLIPSIIGQIEYTSKKIKIAPSMIKVERSAYHGRPSLDESIQAAKQQLETFFEIPTIERIQLTPPFEQSIERGFRSALAKAFNFKCAYCERPVLEHEGVVDQFRPKFGATDLEGRKSSDHYWWLAYEWLNLYWSCGECNLNKGVRFPVKGKRGRIRHSIQELYLAENFLLVDPCFDDPREHLVFSRDGKVTPLTVKGRTTIQVFDLNRSSLIAQRQSIATGFLETAELLVKDRSYTSSWGVKSIAPDRSFVALRRDTLAKLLRDMARTTTGSSKAQLRAWQEEMRPSRFTVDKQKKLETQYREEEATAERASITSDFGSQYLHSKTQYISRIEIRNFRNLENVVVDLPKIQRRRKPSVIFIGENGVGKSSILKAIALVLMSTAERKKLRLKASDILRRGAENGSIAVYVQGYTQPFRLDFSKHSAEIISNGMVLKSLLFCYGGTRLLPTKQAAKRSVARKFSRVGNLFDPFLPLSDAKAWLLSLTPLKFEYSAKAIKKVLASGDDRILVRSPLSKPTRVELADQGGDARDSLEVLSDGYQSVIAFVADILEVALMTYTDAEDSEGIILIDEIDVHLHPSWKIEIVELLRQVFPRAQFLMTTHDPLCLLGALPGEIQLLNKNLETEKIEIIKLDLPAGITADRILTGFWFQLSSTTDLDTRDLLDRHQHLLGVRQKKRGKLNVRQAKELAAIDEKLRIRLGTFSDTSVDRLVQSVASEILSENLKNINLADREKFREAVRKRANELFDKPNGGRNPRAKI